MGNSQSEIRKYNVVLDDIQKQRINMDKDLVRENKEILGYILEQKILPELKKDVLFESLYECPYYTGSTYEGLRISAPTEFDINLIFDLPFNYEEDLILDELTKTYGTISLNDDFDRLWHPNRGDYARCKDIKKYFLDKHEPRKFNALSIHQWFIGVLGKALERLEFIYFKDRTYKLKYSVKNQSGPAHTLHVFRMEDNVLVFDVDLVPVFEFEDPNFEDLLVERTKSKYLVPKKPKDLDQFQSENVDHIFRISYAPKERLMLDNQKNAKTVIKFLKLLRDSQNWFLVSYHLKTIVMNLNFKTWKEENQLANYLNNAAQSLEFHLREHYLPMKHDHRHNLFGHIKNVSLDKIADRLSRIIREVQADPDKLYVYLKAVQNGSRGNQSKDVSRSSTAECYYDQSSDSEYDDEEIGGSEILQAAATAAGAATGGAIAYKCFKKEGENLTDDQKAVVALSTLAGAFLGNLAIRK
eukprot:TCONS_00030897-protein